LFKILGILQYDQIASIDIKVLFFEGISQLKVRKYANVSFEFD